MNNIGNIFRHEVDPRSHLPSYKLLDTNVFIGVEIELEDITIPSNFKLKKHPFWSVTYDDSLRGDSVELRVKYPLKGIDLVHALQVLTESVAKLKEPPNVSDRTSTHIHIDARYLTTTQLYNWIVLCVILEKMLYKYVGTKRAKSIFCVPFYKAAGSLNTINILIEATDNDNIYYSLIDNFNENFRYSGINLNALFKFGSIEFRMLDGEWRKDKLLLWINILLAIRTYAINLKVPIENLIEDLLYKDTIGIIENIFGDIYEVLEYPDIKYDIICGCRIANDVVKANINSQISWDVVQLDKINSLKGDFISKFKSNIDDTSNIVPDGVEEEEEEYTTLDIPSSQQSLSSWYQTLPQAPFINIGNIEETSNPEED